MRTLLLLAGLLVSSSLLSAQVDGLPLGRPQAYPMMYFDEETGVGDVTRVDFPRDAWDEAVSCLAQHGVIAKTPLFIPSLAVIPVAKTIRIHDWTKDSLLVAEGAAAEDIGRWEAPTIAYALIHSGLVLATTTASQRHSTMRHEAIHFVLWEVLGPSSYGHPSEYFNPCDRDYQSP